MYGTFKQKMNDKSIDVLNKIAELPSELWIQIMGNCITFNIACLNKQFYDAFHTILLDKLDKVYLKCETQLYNYHKKSWENYCALYQNTMLLLSYRKGKTKSVKDTIDACISNHPHAYSILKYIDRESLILDNGVNEKQYIFLCDIYHYPYQSILEWKVKGYCCLAVYLPCFIALCPIWCPINCYNVAKHPLREDDHIYKVCQPFNVCFTKSKKYYDPCDFDKYVSGDLCTFDEPRATGCF